MKKILDAYNERIIVVKEDVEVDTLTSIDIDDLTVSEEIDLSEIIGKSYLELTEKQKEILGDTSIWESPFKEGIYNITVDFNNVGLAVVATLLVTEEDEEIKFDNEHKLYFPITDYIEL